MPIAQVNKTKPKELTLKKGEVTLVMTIIICRLQVATSNT